MYCPHCELHFSGGTGGGLCPYCGKSAEPSDPEREARAVATLGSQGPDDTRTEIRSDWSPGALIAGKYEVVSRLGAGGFGTVYKVRHIFRKKYYALKTPHAEFARDEVFRARFEREIEAMERFVHPDAVMIRDSGMMETGMPYYTMDFIEGESLKVVLRREGRLPVDRALRIIRRVLRVLEVAHAHQIIHRDIKPDNILLTRESGRETVKVLDFGVAKLLDLVGDTGSGSLTRGMRVGTPKYMSPEQITAEPVDTRSDLFSLGIVFYEMVTGTHPFAQLNDPIRVTAAILNRAPAPPRERVPELSKTINDYIIWMLEKKARRRPSSARLLVQQLGAVEEGVSRVEPLEHLQVSKAVRRTPAVTLVLRQETSLGERRSFCLFRERVTFGRTSDPARGIHNDLIWRCLPCRSQASDPENWQRNLTISQSLGSIHPEGTTLVIEPSPQAKYGIGVGGVRSLRTVRIQTDRFHISLGDKALELDGHRALRSIEQPEPDLSCLAHSRPLEAGAAERIGYSNPDCLIDHVHFQRASNWPLHEYFLVYRQVKIGSSANAGMRLRTPGVEGIHAALIYEEGEAFLLPLAGKTVVRGKLEETAGVSELELTPDCVLPLRAGLEICMGEAHLWVDAALDSQFKTV
jgi:serine/threonine protein kinase